MGVAAAERRFVFEGREVTLPVVVRDASSAAAVYLVWAAAARRLLPGRALFSVACGDYLWVEASAVVTG